MKVVRKPYKDFARLSDRGKRNQSSKIKRNFSKGAILHAAKSLICKGGKVRHSDILIDQLARDPKYAELVNKEMKKMKPKKASPLRALAHKIDCDMSVGTYVKNARFCKAQNADIFYCKEKIKEEEDACKPTGIEVGEWKVVIPFKRMRLKTLVRWLEIKENRELIEKARMENGGTIELEDIWKYGFDGMGEMEMTNQKKETTEADNSGDSDEHFDNPLNDIIDVRIIFEN